MTYRIVMEKRATKAMKKLPKIVQRRIDAVIDLLRHDPFLGKKLEGDFEGAWVIRAWPYRIIYTIENTTITVTIVRIGHRQSVYQK